MNAGRDLFDKCSCNVFLISITPVSKKEEIARLVTTFLSLRVDL